MCTAQLAPFISPSIARRASPVLFGGSDAHNMIIPLGSEYASCAASTGNLAISTTSVIPVSAGVSRRSFGFLPTCRVLQIFSRRTLSPRETRQLAIYRLKLFSAAGCCGVLLPLRINEIVRVRRGINANTALRDNFFLRRSNTRSSFAICALCAT